MKTTSQTQKNFLKAIFTGTATSHQYFIMFLILISIALPVLFIFGHINKY